MIFSGAFIGIVPLFICWIGPVSFKHLVYKFTVVFIEKSVEKN